jgi:hypothetical protein
MDQGSTKLKAANGVAQLDESPLLAQWSAERSHGRTRAWQVGCLQLRANSAELGDGAVIGTMVGGAVARSNARMASRVPGVAR